MTIDDICRETTNPTLLNALHACRPGHPWNKTAVRPWHNALFLARGQTFAKRLSNEAIDFLERQAKAEAVS